jgi:hypothetical protein
MAGADFGFVGQAYDAPNPYQDNQKLINWYLERTQDDKSKMPTTLLGAPGLNPLIQLGVVGQVRGCWVLPGGNSAIWVSGNTAYLVTTIVPATQNTIAQFSTTTLGTLLTNSGQVCIRDNGAGGYAILVDGPYGYTYNLTTGVFAQIADPAFLGSDRVDFIDGWLIFNQPGTQNFYTSAPTPYTVTFNGSFFAKNDSSSDNLVTFAANNRELWLVGERHTEIWYDAGGAQFAFQRIPGAAPQIGCSAKHSITRVGDSLVWLAKSERGENIVVRTKQYTWEEISTHAISHQISTYPLISDAFAYSYEEEGHLFYVLTFPTADKTWVYDATASAMSDVPVWHERASYDTPTGTFHRHRSNCFCNLQDLRLVGDYTTGQIHQMSRNYYTDAGNPLIAVRRCPHIWSREDRERVFHSRLQIEFAPGVGLQTGQGSNPQAMLRWSDDAGANFGSEHWTSIGKAGQMKNRAIWRRLGHARDRVYEVRFSDPTKRDVIGATLFAEGTENSEAA